MKRSTIVISALVVNSSVALGQCGYEGEFYLPADNASHDRFGSAIVIDGSLMLVSASDAQTGGVPGGAVYVYDRATRTELLRFSRPGGLPGDAFGSTIALHGTTAMIGAPLYDGSHINQGASFLFDVTTGAQLFELPRPPAGLGENFGGTGDLDGTHALLGVASRNGGNGAVLVYDIATGSLLDEWLSPMPEPGELFGVRVVIADGVAYIGAQRTTVNGRRNAGSVYAIDIVTGTPLDQFTAADAGRDDWFGDSLAVSGDRLIVGAPQDNNTAGTEAGAVYVFSITTGDQLFKYVPSGATTGARVGTSVAVSGDVGIVGGHDNATPWDAVGNAHLFDLTNGQEIARLQASDTVLGDGFGRRVAIDGQIAYVCAAAHNDGAGREGGLYRFEQIVPSGPCPPDLNDDCRLDFFDVLTFLNLFADQHPSADFALDGVYDFFDVQAFLDAFSAGCP